MKRIVASYTREQAKRKAIDSIYQDIMRLADRIDEECDRFLEFEDEFDLKALENELMETAQFIHSQMNEL